MKRNITLDTYLKYDLVKLLLKYLFDTKRKVVFDNYLKCHLKRLLIEFLPRSIRKKINRKKIVAFGNCQAAQLAKLLLELLPPLRFSVYYLSNNKRTGNLRQEHEILSTIGECDILIYQPLGLHHGELCEENLKKITRSDCILISFPYIFNSGVYSLCHAPLVDKHHYGLVYGEDIIIDILNTGKSKEEIICDYKNGMIDFNLIERFNKCLSEMRKRESSTEIKLSEFILSNYQKKKLFVTHNHPSNLIFFEIIRQITDIASLPIGRSHICESKTPDLHETICPVTTHDIKVHGYQFDADSDWFIKGESLLQLIIDSHLCYRLQRPRGS